MDECKWCARALVMRSWVTWCVACDAAHPPVPVVPGK